MNKPFTSHCVTQTVISKDPKLPEKEYDIQQQHNSKLSPKAESSAYSTVWSALFCGKKKVPSVLQ